MPNTDFPKYLGLAGRLTDDNDDLNNDIYDGVTLMNSGPSYPDASQQLNNSFAQIVNGLADEDKPEYGSELYIRLRDVAPLIRAVRTAIRDALADDPAYVHVTNLSAHLARLTDIPDNALS